MVKTLEHPVVKKYEAVFEIYTDVASRTQLSLIESMIFEGKMAGAEKLLSQFKTEDELMQVLERKLSGKPIDKTLKKIRKGVIESKAQILKGLFSLGTHAIIEVEAGNSEYLYVAKRIHEKIGQLI